MSQVVDATDFLKVFFRQTTGGNIFLVSFVNNDAPAEAHGRPYQYVTPDLDGIDAFVTKRDVEHRGLYFCTGTVPGRERNRESIVETPGLWADIDFKGVAYDAIDQVHAAVKSLKYRPTIIVHSGHGLHLYWLFEDAVDTQAHRERLEKALRAVCELVAGDTQVCEVSRVMRLPGTHNTKFSSRVPVTVEYLDGPRYTLEDLEAWAESNTRPILQRRAGAVSDAAADAGAPTNPFLRVAAEQGYKPPVDVDTQLAGMVYPGNVHATQVSVSAAMLERGFSTEEVVARLVAETQKVPGTGKFNWGREERDLRKMCQTWLEKHPQQISISRGVETTKSENVVDIGEARTKRKPKPAADNVPKHVVLGSAVMAAMHTAGEDLLLSDKGAYRYIDKLWRLVLERDLVPWLNGQLEVGAQILGMDSNNRLINEARSWILRQPELYRSDISFDDHGMVPTKSGLVDPRTGALTPPDPEHYATWRIECDYIAAARCPHWLRMLSDVLGDRNPELRQQYIDLIQELLGAGLIDAKGKSLSKALVFWGPQDSGKSGLVDVLAGLFGDDRNTVGFADLEKAHATTSFLKRRPWALHEAFDQSAWHFSSVVKSIISGDHININVKNGPLLSQRYRAPIFWATNHAPQFKEATRAIVERMIIVACQRKFDQDNPTGVATIAHKQGYATPAELVLDTEMEGLLAWAIAGLLRCLERGHFIVPAEAKEVAEEVRRDSNLVAGFVEDCGEFTPHGMVSAPDFCASFASWWLENKGEDRRIPSNDSVGKALSALGEQRIGTHRTELRTNARRYYAGIHLNTEGLRFWKNTITADAFQFKGRRASTSSVEENPNAVIPATWDEKHSVRVMRLAFAREKNTSGTQESPVTGDVSSVTPVSPKASHQKTQRGQKDPRF